MVPADSTEEAPEDVAEAAEAIEQGDLVVYPTETVYGLGADALDPEAIEAVFEAKDRDTEDPVSLAVPDVDAALAFVSPRVRERRFMHAFLPGPVTVVLERRDPVPDVLTAGRDRVGVRIPDHEVALALLERVAPITATSANRSGEDSVHTPEDLAESVREAAGVVIDDGETPGTESTVVDVGEDEILREGAMAEEIEDWLEEH